MKTRIENQIATKKVTVDQLIKSLAKYRKDAFVEIEIDVYNDRYPIAHVNPKESAWVDNSFATMRNGETVRISVSMPESETHYMTTSVRRK